MSILKPTVFTGAATALITPFRDGAIDYPAMEALIEEQIEKGISALLVSGTTGESATLSYAEHRELIAFAKSCIGGRVPLLAGCGSNSTANALQLVQNACEAGADALLAVTPYYNKTSARGIILHYRAIADAATRPLILYNVPSRTGFSIPPDAYRALADHPNIVGVKEASGDLGLLEMLVSECGDRLDVWTGNDNQTVSSMKLGARGVISVYSNLEPHAMTEITRLCAGGDWSLAGQRLRAHLPKMNALFWEVNPIPVKYVASLRGICLAEYRLPLCSPSPDICKRLKGLFS
ncbi:MAG: 4-hydroxy-tetrahydrodipicolinate synthase [Clostridia bacterium]|nr:4-hydroxy-tetrahydrodipicolinate synthase [Clostridia bacterium]